jgi:hypothetical protein
MFSPFASRLKNIQLAELESSLFVAQPGLHGGKRGDAIPRGRHNGSIIDIIYSSSTKLFKQIIHLRLQ